MNGNAVVTIDPQAPGTPAQPAGPAYPESGTTVSYTTTGSSDATSYLWTVDPVSAGTFSGTGTTGTITWSSSFTGQATINVKGVNSCGNGPVASLTVDVVAVGIAEPTKEHFVSVYPNPARNIINLKPYKTLKADIQFVNYIGTTLIDLRETTISSTYKLDISGLKPGIYFIKINAEGGQQITKVVIE
jgi:hypothetical protein